MQEHPAIFQDRCLRPQQAATKLGIGVSTLWRYAKNDPNFPPAIRISSRCTIFLESHIDAYLAKRVAEAKQAA